MNAYNNIPLELLGKGDIKIIGPRKSGKTTFMAALARWPNADVDSPIQSIDPYDESAGQLIGMAKDILEDGRELSGTDYTDNANNSPTYTLLITLKPSLFKHPIAKLKGQDIRLQVSCREYSGELIKDLRSNTSSQIMENYLNDCASAGGLLLLIDGTSTSDREYAEAFENLQRGLNERLRLENGRLSNCRIAVVFTKCEQPSIWINRNDFRRFASLKFPLTQKVLSNWGALWRCDVNYFFCSAFGTKGIPPRPNFRLVNKDNEGVYGVIDKPSIWRPLGLIAPLYWLQTGYEDARLRNLEN
jgi:GTPase SAR1 family protein